MKTEAREEARSMRLEGSSIREIEQRLRIARSSVSRWVSDIELTPQQFAEPIYGSIQELGDFDRPEWLG